MIPRLSRSGRAGLVAATVLALAAGLTACAPATASGQACDQSAKRNLGVVAGSTANAPTAALSTSAVAQLEAVGKSNGSVTVVVPIANVLPDVGLAMTASVPSTRSLALGAKVAIDPEALVASTTMSAGTEITGAVVSTTVT